MRRLAVTAIALLMMASFATRTEASSIQIDFSNAPGAKVNFTGGSFSFVDSAITGFSGYDIFITNVAGAVMTGSSLGYLGNLGGLFAIGAITTVGTTQSAPVTATTAGTLSFKDSIGNLLTAAVSWLSINTTSGTGASSGVVNINGVVNLSNLQYAGVDSDLYALYKSTGGIATITYQFVPGKTLTQLKAATGAGFSTSYSGSIAADTAVPEPASLTLLGSGLLGTIAMVRRRRKNASK